jgi:hypothetical protein
MFVSHLFTTNVTLVTCNLLEISVIPEVTYLLAFIHAWKTCIMMMPFFPLF